MTTTFGDAAPGPATLPRALRLVFRGEHLALKWSHCSSTADFLSQYYTEAAREGLDAAARRDLSHSIAYLANELVENAIKFHAPGDVTVEAGVDGEDFVLRIAHHITPETGERFSRLLREITVGDPGELLIQRIEANAAGHNTAGSGLGILTLRSDYGVRLAWQFEPAAAPDSRVHLLTVARLSLPEARSATPPLRKHHGN